MPENWKELVEKKDKFNLYILFIILLFATFIEMLGIGSIPLFAMLITNPNQLIDYLPDWLSLNFIIEVDRKKIIFIGSILLLVVFVFKNLFLGFMNYFQAFTIKELRINIYKKLFALYINSDYEFHLLKNPSELIRNITSEVGRSSNYILNSIMLIKEALIMITIFTLLLSIDFKISLLTFSLSGSFALIFYLATKKGAKKRGKIVQIFWAAILKAVNQGLGSVKETKILNKENYILDIFNKNIKVVEKYNLHQNFMVILPKLFLEVIAILTIVVVSVFFIFFDRNQSNYIPLITLITVASIRLMPSVNTVTSSIARLKYLSPSFTLISEEIKKLKKSIKNSNNKINQENNNKIIFNKSLDIKNIVYYYPNSKKKVIDNISFKINYGEIIGVIGQSGAGKSTLIDLIVGLLNATEGEILVDGKNINLSKKNWQKQIGYIPQEVYLFDDTIRSNIAFGVRGNDINEADLKNSIKLAELEKFIESLPDKENTIVGDRGVWLSGGQKQRIGIARSLYFKPKILIFDEPTGSLDVKNEEKIMNHIFSLGGNLTIIIISHRISILKDCIKIINLVDGKIKEITSYESLLEKNN